MRISQNTSARNSSRGFLPNRKAIKLTLLFLFSPIYFFAQTLTGLWTGVLRNDSNSVRKDQSFEIALTEYRGKVYGYSRSEFIVHDTLYYIVKRVKGTIDGDKCDVKDEEILSFNFPGKLDKGVKVTSTFYRSKTDSTWRLDGSWKTNQTKNYYSITGKVALAEERDLAKSKLFPHLEELNLADDVAFYKEQKNGAPLLEMKTVAIREINPDGVLTAAPDLSSANSQTNLSAVKIKSVPLPVEERKIPVQSTNGIDSSASIQNEKEEQRESVSEFTAPVVVGGRADDKNELLKKQAGNRENVQQSIKSTGSRTIAVNSDPLISAKTNIIQDIKTTPSNEHSNKISKIESVPTEPVKINSEKLMVKNDSQVVAKTNSKVNTPVNTVAVAQKNQSQPSKTDPSILSNKNTVAIVKTEVPVNKPIESTPIDQKKPEIATILPATSFKEIKDNDSVLRNISSFVAGRQSVFSQTVLISSDSLQLSLYDNGEIDGDTVSVYLNGEILMARQGLKASAIKKTIYFNKDDELVLVLFADNLGKYPPNTGLLVVHDGDDVYNIRFSADLQKNAAIVFRRKK